MVHFKYKFNVKRPYKVLSRFTRVSHYLKHKIIRDCLHCVCNCIKIYIVSVTHQSKYRASLKSGALVDGSHSECDTQRVNNHSPAIREKRVINFIFRSFAFILNVVLNVLSVILKTSFNGSSLKGLCLFVVFYLCTLIFTWLPSRFTLFKQCKITSISGKSVIFVTFSFLFFVVLVLLQQHFTLITK